MFYSRQNRGPSDFDLKYSAALNFSYPLPAVTSGALMHVAGGWELDGILQAQTGYPFSPLVGFDQARLRASSADPGQRPDLVAARGAKIILGDDDLVSPDSDGITLGLVEAAEQGLRYSLPVPQSPRPPVTPVLAAACRAVPR